MAGGGSPVGSGPRAKREEGECSKQTRALSLEREGTSTLLHLSKL